MSDWLSLIIATTGLITSGLLAYLAYSLNRQSQRSSIHRSLGNLYEELLRYRTAHPEVMKLSNDWTDACFSVIYHQNKKADHVWVVYYSYAEMVCDFTNTVLYGRESHALDRRAYEKHYKPLVRLLLTEHYPFIKSCTDGPYLSMLLRDFISDETRKGWDWEARRLALVNLGNMRQGS